MTETGRPQHSMRREPASTTVGYSPFHLAAATYLKAGFMPFPLPIGKKYPPPKGVPNDINIDEKLVDEWLQDPRPKNIGTIIPEGVVVIDVDGLPGKESLKELENEFGTLSNTWISFRGDPDRYHLWYSIPQTLDNWGGKLGAGLDLITRHYRYVVLPPSVHPSGAQYRWVKP